MHMHLSRLSCLVVVVSLTACGSAASSAQGGASPKHRLLAAADAAAKANSGTAKYVEAVATSRGAAADLTGHSNLPQGEKVWVVQVSGDDYSCGTCSVPFAGSAPSGRYLTLVLRQADFVGSDFGIGPKATNLAALGHVEVLRDER